MQPAAGSHTALKGGLIHDYPERFRYYDMLVSAFVAVLLVSNIVAPKFIAFGPLRFSGAQLLFPITYIIVALPASPEWRYQDAYATVLGVMPRLGVASLVAYWAGEFANSFVMARMKVLTQGRHLWMRTIGSTAVGQAVDSVLVMVIAFAGVMSTSDIVRAIISGYI